MDALVAAGYYGKSDSADVVPKDMTGAKDGKVSSLMVNDVHLCCGKCVTAVQKALEKVKNAYVPEGQQPGPTECGSPPRRGCVALSPR